MDRVSWVDAGITGLGVNAAPVVDFVAAPTGVTVNARLCKWGSSGDDKPGSTPVVRTTRLGNAAVRVGRDGTAVELARRDTKAEVRVWRD